MAEMISLANHPQILQLRMGRGRKKKKKTRDLTEHALR